MRRAFLLLALIPLALGAQPISVRVIDGDTIDAGYDQNVRLVLDGGAPFDTPEIYSPACQDEELLGAHAKLRLLQLLRTGIADLEILPGTCGHGRYCGALSVGGVNVGETLIAEGLAARSRNADWCG